MNWLNGGLLQLSMVYVDRRLERNGVGRITVFSTSMSAKISFEHFERQIICVTSAECDFIQRVFWTLLTIFLLYYRTAPSATTHRLDQIIKVTLVMNWIDNKAILL